MPQCHFEVRGGRAVQRIQGCHGPEELGPLGGHRAGDGRGPVKPRDGGFHGAAGIFDVALDAFEQDQSERIDVACRTQVGAPRLFRAQVRGGSHHGAGGGEPGPVHKAGDPEVGEFRPQRFPGPDRYKQDVGRLDIPVDDAERVHIGQGIRDPGPDDRDLIQRQRAVPDPGPEVLPIHKFHGQERPWFLGDAAVRAGVEECHQARMVQGCQQLDLGFLTPEFVRVGGLRGKELQCHIAAQIHVLGAVNGRHSAPADHFPEPVAAAQELCLVAIGRTVHACPRPFPRGATAAPPKNDTGTGICSLHGGRGPTAAVQVGCCRSAVPLGPPADPTTVCLAGACAALSPPSGPNDGLPCRSCVPLSPPADPTTVCLAGACAALSPPSGPNDGLPCRSCVPLSPPADPTTSLRPHKTSARAGAGLRRALLKASCRFAARRRSGRAVGSPVRICRRQPDGGGGCGGKRGAGMTAADGGVHWGSPE
ncbi:hypothetical protein BJQ90_03999 [Arthrobacter sp. SO3]|nr:hypothetical protein [Arthrobacter sp. SO3]